MSAHRPAPRTVGYLTKRFPRLSETFILDEILGLEQAGVPLRLFAVAHPGEGLTQPDVALVRSGVTYVRSHGRWARTRGTARTLVAHAVLLARNPRRYRSALRAAVAERARTGTIRPFLDAGRLAVALHRAGAAHLHAAFAHGPASTARLVHLLTGMPYSFSAHAKDLYLSDPAELATKARDAAFVLTCSAAAKAGLVERVSGGDRVLLAYHGVDTGRFRPADRRGDGVHTVLAVGRLVPKKGYPVLLAALRQLADRGHEVTCRIVGDGPERPALEEQVRALELDGRVTLLGSRTHQQIADEYRRADAFVQASVVLADGDRDGVPNALLEAMASGLPVVASAVSGIPEAVEDGRSGLLVAPGDPRALADAIARVLETPGLAASLGGGARTRVVAQFDRSVCAARLAPLFTPDEIATPVGAGSVP